MSIVALMGNSVGTEVHCCSGNGTIMNSKELIQREKLAREFKSLVSFGATPQQAIQCLIFKELTLAKYPGVEASEIGVVMCELLKEVVVGLPEKDAEAAIWLFKFLETTDSALMRRKEAIRARGPACSPETYRRPVDPSPELNFMREIADAFMKYLELTTV